MLQQNNTALEASQQAYAMRNLRAEPEENLVEAVKRASEKRNKEVGTGKADHEKELHSVADMDEPNITNAVKAIKSEQLKRQLKHQAETAQQLLDKQHDAALTQVSCSYVFVMCLCF